MVVFPHAKINLGLNVLEKRSDGFHNIESVFYPIGLADILEIIELQSSAQAINMNVSGLAPESPVEQNLVYKCILKLKEKYNLPPLKVHLHKIIPLGAGLGGGSSDASYTLHLLNELFHLKINRSELKNLARQLGSDCTYFIDGGVKLVGGTGELLSPYHLELNNYYIVLVKSEVHVSTVDAYSSIVPTIPNKSIAEILKNDISNWRHELKNDFESVIFRIHPKLERIKNQLYKSGALYAAMSGSGSAIYGIFEREPHLEFSLSDCFVWKSKL